MSHRRTVYRVVRPLGAGAVLLAVCLGGLFTTVAAPPAAPPAGDAAVPKSTVQAHRLVDLAARATDDRKKLGAAILTLMKSGTLDPAWWEECLLALGDLQYEPAAEYVAEHVATPKVFREGVRRPGGLGDPENRAPAIGVLRQIGPAAVEPLVMKFLKGWKPREPGDDLADHVGYYILSTLNHPRLRGEAVYFIRKRQQDYHLLQSIKDERPASLKLLEWLEGVGAKF